MYFKAHFELRGPLNIFPKIIDYKYMGILRNKVADGIIV
jgi:hypothetical protein